MSIKLLKEGLRFGVVGAAATAVHVSVVVALVETDLSGVFWSNFFAFNTAVFVSYFGHKNWTFKATGLFSELLPKFFATAVLGLCLNQLIMYVGTNIYKAHYQLLLALAVTVVPLVVYVLNKFWVFSHPHKAL